MEIGTYKALHGKDGKFTHRMFKRIINWLKVALWRSAIVCAFGWAVVSGYALREFDNSRTIAYAATAPFMVAPIEMQGKSVDQLEDEVIGTLAQCESGNNKAPLIQYDNNSHGTLKGKDIPSLGILRFKIGTIQTYEKQLNNKTLSEKEAITEALDDAQAESLAKQIIFHTKGGIENWMCADATMKIRVGLLKEMQ